MTVTPSSGPRASPLDRRASDRRASSRAVRRSRVVKALILGSTASSLASWAFAASTGESGPWRAAASAAVM